MNTLPAASLYPLDHPFFGIPYPTSSSITVLDTPEPTTLLGTAIGGLVCLIGARRRLGR